MWHIIHVYRKTSIDFEVMGTRGSEDGLKVNVESDEKSEKTVTKEKSEKRFKSCLRKIINLIINMADDFEKTLPIFDGKDYSTRMKRVTVLFETEKM